MRYTVRKPYARYLVQARPLMRNYNWAGFGKRTRVWWYPNINS